MKGRVDFGIITIREDEFEAVLDRFPEDLGIVSGRRQYNIRRIAPEDPYTVAIVRCAHQANSEAQQVANALLDELAPRWLLVVGIGGGAPAHEFTLGDVVVATEVCDFNVGAVLRDGSHEYALHGWMSHPEVAKLVANLPAMRRQLGAWNSRESVRCARPDVRVSSKSLSGGPKWKKKLKEVMDHHVAEGRQEPKVTAGAIACSDLVIKDAELFQVWLKLTRQVIAVEMESAGIHKAAQDGQTPFLSIRGLSDIVGFSRDPKWTAYACHSAAAFTQAFLLTRPIPPRTHGEAAGPGPRPATPQTETTPPALALPPRPPRFVGRDALADQITIAILRDPAPSIVLLGPGGIGKSTLTLAALHRPEIAARFGARRWFVRLDAAPTAEAAVGLIASALPLSPGANPFAEVRAFLGRAAGVLALDNLETPWEGDREATDSLLGELAAISGLVLVASVRGVERPAGVAWKEHFEVRALDDDPAADLFCDIARAERGDPVLAALLARLAGVPLAITLLAHVAEGANLAGVVEEWENRHTALLAKEGTRPGRETSWAASMTLSVESPRMTGEAKRLLALLGRLPDGVAFADVDKLLPGNGNEAKRKLVQVGLAYEEDERLRLLAPVREYVSDGVPVPRKDLARTMAHYGELARTLGPKAGNEGGAEAVARLAPETANLDAMIRGGLEGRGAARWIEAALALTNFARSSGRSLPSPLARAQDVAQRSGDTRKNAGCLLSLGLIAYSRSDNNGARRRYEEALPLFRQLNSVVDEANCIKGLALIAASQSDAAGAQRQCEVALLLYRRGGDRLGEANCIRTLADVAFHRWDYDRARNGYEEARHLFRQVNDVLGEAACIQGLGDIALARSDPDGASRHYDAALPLFRHLGDVVGEADCIRGLASVALSRSDHEGARRGYGEALLLYRRVGVVVGEANCIQSLGDIALASSDAAQAKERYTTSVALYARIPEPYSMANSHWRLARLATEQPERRYHVDIARALWTQIGRHDLAIALDVEFTPAPASTLQSSPNTPLAPPASTPAAR